MSDARRPTRRDFSGISTGTISTAALSSATVVGSLNAARAAHAQGSDQLRVALVGCGGRGQGAAHNCVSLNRTLRGVRIRLVAVADAFADKAREAADRLRGDASLPGMVDLPRNRVFGGFDAYRQATDCGVDLVILATPPGFRPLHYRYAIEAGKHVFMERPCCVDAPGFRSLIQTNELADRKGLKVVVGLQRRHDARYQETVKRVRDGALGDVMLTRAYWTGGGVWTRTRAQLAERLRRKPTEMEYQMYNWYYFVWLSGDHICEQHVDNLDVCNWVHGNHPVEANGMGGRQVRTDAIAAARGFRPGVWGQIYDHHVVEFTYADGARMYSQCRHVPNCFNTVSECAHGSDGYAELSEAKISGATEWRYTGPDVRPYNKEHVDLVEAIRKDLPLNDGWHGATSSFTAVLGRMASYSGKVVTWDEAVANGRSEMPAHFAWDAPPPVLPDKRGSYEHAVPMPGVFDPFG